MEETNNIPINKENKSIKWVLFIIIFLVVLLVIFIGVVYFKGIGKGYFIYEGLGGKYRIDIVKFGNMTDYYIHITANDKFYTYPFRVSPKDLENTYLEPDVKDFIINKKGVYITHDENVINFSKMWIGEIEYVRILGTRQDLGGLYNLGVSAGYTIPIGEYPVIHCSNVTSEIGVIYYKLGENAKVYSDDGCVIIEGKTNEDFLYASEKFGYHLLEVF